MQQPFHPKSDVLLRDYASPESGNIRISSFPESHRFFSSDPFWGVRITGYQRSENRGRAQNKEA